MYESLNVLRVATNRQNLSNTEILQADSGLAFRPNWVNICQVWKYVTSRENYHVASSYGRPIYLNWSFSMFPSLLVIHGYVMILTRLKFQTTDLERWRCHGSGHFFITKDTIEGKSIYWCQKGGNRKCSSVGKDVGEGKISLVVTVSVLQSL